MTQIRERTRYRDLVVADRPPAGHQNELPDLSARLVATDRGRGVLVPAVLELDRGRSVWTAKCGRTDE